MRNAKNSKENTFLLIALFSTNCKEKITFFHTPSPQMYAPNPYCAYIPCSIIIETRPEEGANQNINLSSSIASKLNSDIGHQTDLPRKRKCFLCLLLLCALVPWDMGLDAEIYLGVLTRRFWQLSTVRAQLKSTQKGLSMFLFN